MHRITAITLLCAILITLLAGCNGNASPTTGYSKEPESLESFLEETDPTEAEQGEGSQVQSNEYCAPWKTDVIAGAKGDGKLHYYFMSSEGKPMISTATYPKKWGDSCLMVLPDGTTVLIDTGHGPYAEVLVQNLRQMGVTRIDYLMISHFHPDHYGGAVEPGGVLDSFPVGQVFVTNAEDTSNGDLAVKCLANSIPVKTLMQDDEMQLGQLQMRVLWPTKIQASPPLDDSTQVNNTSFVVRFDYNGHSSLFTGDIYTSVEQTLTAQYPELLDVDLLKAPHHGDSTSNGPLFVQAVSPELVVVTGYSGLSKLAQVTYESLGVQLLSDQSRGYIHIAVDGTDMEWDSSR